MKKILFVGNPNVGKSALINLLAGTNLKIGNWPGVSTEKKEALYIFENEKFNLVDLPGIYDLSGINEEQISVNALKENNYDLIINVVDVTNLQRNLLLTLQLRTLQRKMIIFLSFGDLIEKFDCYALAKKLQLPVYLIRDKTVAELKMIIFKVINNPAPVYHFLDNEFIDAQLKKLVIQLNYSTDQEKYGRAWEMIILDQGAGNLIRHDIEKRYQDNWDNIIEKQYLKTTNKIVELTQLIKKDRYKKTFLIDKLLLNKFLAFPMFLILMYIMFSLIFSFSLPLSDYNRQIVNWISNSCYTLLTPVNQPFAAFISFGVIAGVGNVIAFIPQLFLLFCLIAFLEESGYISRLAFIFDRLFKNLGISGKAVISLLLGFGCSVPAVMSLRTLENKKAKRITSLMIPFFSCSAKLPVFFLISSVLFPRQAPLVIIAFYFLGIIMALLVATIANILIKNPQKTMFVLELPPYMMPSIKTILKKSKFETIQYLKKAGGIIMFAVIILYFISHFPVNSFEGSLLYYLAKTIKPVFAPLGIDNLTLIASLPGAFIAKEIVIAFLYQNTEIIIDYNIIAELQNLVAAFPNALKQAVISLFDFNMFSFAIAKNDSWVSLFGDDGKEQLRAFSFLLFILLMTPCIATMATIKKELGIKNAVVVLIITLIVPYFVCLTAYNLANFIFY